MSETDEEKKKRWAKSRAMSYMTPAMAHAMAMSKYQSQNKYKEQFNKTKGKGYTAVASTPELEHVKKQSVRQSQTKYKSEFEKNKAKFTQVADDPETLRVRKVTNQVSKIAYEGKGSAIAESKFKKYRATSASQDAEPHKSHHGATEAEKSYGRPVEEDTIQEEHQPQDSTRKYSESDNQTAMESTSAYDDSKDSEEVKQPETEEPEESHSYDNAAEEDYTPQENGDNYYKQEEQYSAQAPEDEEVVEASEGREYREADADDQEVKEFTEGGLDDFYANLG